MKLGGTALAWTGMNASKEFASFLVWANILVELQNMEDSRVWNSKYKLLNMHKKMFSNDLEGFSRKNFGGKHPSFNLF